MATTMKLIAKNVLGSDTASVTFSDIPATYDDLLLLVSARTAFTGANWSEIRIRPNNATTNQDSRFAYGTGAAAASGTGSYLAVWGASDSCTASTFGNASAYIPNYAGSTNKSISTESVSESNATSALAVALAGLWSSTAAITSIVLVESASNNFKSGSSFFLYGITKA